MTALFALCLCLAASVTAYAGEYITLPTFDVTLNGTLVENQYREYPLIVYNDITYFPMTYYDCRYLGLTTDWDNDTRALSIKKENITCLYRDYAGTRKNAKYGNAEICSFKIAVNGKAINNTKEKYPLLTFRDVTYFPLTWRFAVEEFGWEYSFDNDAGLVISSDNYQPKTVELPNISGSAAFDGEFYYYNGKVDDDSYIYMASHLGTDERIIHELPKTMLTRSASFISCLDGIYTKYSVGSGAISLTYKPYKIIPINGTVESKMPDKWVYNMHGAVSISVRNESISVVAETSNKQLPYTVKYTVGGKEKEASVPDDLIIGIMIDGEEYDYNRIPREELIKIHGDKIYFIAYECDKKNATSSIYAINTKNGKTEKLIRNAEGAFHVYNGRNNKSSSDSTMIIFGRDGDILRYSEETGKTLTVKENDGSDLVLEGASGEYMIYTVQKSLSGDKTVVDNYDHHAGGGSDDGTIFETKTGTYIYRMSGILAVVTSGESAEDSIRTVVAGVHKGENVDFRTSDVCGGIIAHNGYLTYRTDGRTATVKLG